MARLFEANVKRLVSHADRLAHKWVKGILRSEMVKHSVTYSDLARRLVDVGVVEDEGALRNRVSRGKFSGAFLFQCLTVIGTDKVDIDLYDYIQDALSKERKHGSGGSGARRTAPQRNRIGSTRSKMVTHP